MKVTTKKTLALEDQAGDVRLGVGKDSLSLITVNEGIHHIAALTADDAVRLGVALIQLAGQLDAQQLIVATGKGGGGGG